MSDMESLQAEVERLRVELEVYRQRELADLKGQLAAAREAAEHYRNEAHRINNNFRELDTIDREKIARLEGQVESMRQARIPVRGTK